MYDPIKQIYLIIFFCQQYVNQLGKAQSVVRMLGPTYTMEDVIKCLVREYEGVTSSDIVFKEFYQLKQERGEKV